MVLDFRVGINCVEGITLHCIRIQSEYLQRGSTFQNLHREREIECTQRVTSQFNLLLDLNMLRNSSILIEIHLKPS